MTGTTIGISYATRERIEVLRDPDEKVSDVVERALALLEKEYQNNATILSTRRDRL